MVAITVRGEEEGPAGGRLERLERGLRDGRPHLIVLDGLERVQEDASNSRVRAQAAQAGSETHSDSHRTGWANGLTTRSEPNL